MEALIAHHSSKLYCRTILSQPEVIGDQTLLLFGGLVDGPSSGLWTYSVGTCWHVLLAWEALFTRFAGIYNESRLGREYFNDKGPCFQKGNIQGDCGRWKEVRTGSCCQAVSHHPLANRWGERCKGQVASQLVPLFTLPARQSVLFYQMGCRIAQLSPCTFWRVGKWALTT